MTADASRVPITAILNPASGPGQFVDPNYVAVIGAFRAAGGKILGYVTSSYCTRDLSAVEAEVETYAAFYAIDGIFVDEMANDASQAHLDWYAALYAFIQTNHPSYRVVGNPGTTTQEAYLSRPTVDGLVTYENFADYRGYVPDSWVFGYPSERFAHIPYLVASADTMRAYADLAVRRNAGMIFVTDADLPNPYDRLPDYWSEEVAYVEALRAAEAPEAPVPGGKATVLSVYPSPFRDTCVIRLPGRTEETEILILDARGRVVDRVPGEDGAPRDRIWRPGGVSGREIPAGMYVVLARSGASVARRKILYIR